MVVCSPRFILLVARKTGAFPIKSAVQNIFFAFCLVVWRNLLTFASLLKNKHIGALSSAGLEHLPYKQRVGGSNPSAPTQKKKPRFQTLGTRFFVLREVVKAGYNKNVIWLFTQLQPFSYLCIDVNYTAIIQCKRLLLS